MPEIKLKADTGRTHGSAPSRRLRHDGQIPAIVYGHGIEPTAVAVDARALRSALSTAAGINAVLELEIDGGEHLAMAKDIQRHPVRGTVSHVDFVVVNRNEVVTVEVPIVLIGESSEIKSAGAIVNQELHTLTVQTTPARIPNSIEVDISALAVGGSVRVGDVGLPSGVTTDIDPDSVVVTGQAAVVEIAEAAEAGEAAAEAGEGEAAAEASGEGAGEEQPSEG